MRDAVLEKGSKQPINGPQVLRLAELRARDYFLMPVKPFALVSGLSIKTFPAKRIVMEGCRIEPLSSRERYPYPSFPTFLRNPEVTNRLDASSKNQLIRVTTSGRTIYQAAEKAFRALNLLRGLWSLCATYGTWSMSFTGINRKPIGVIHSSLIHTIHNPDGKLAHEMYWFDRDSVEVQELFEPKRGWAEVEKFRLQSLKRLSRSRFRRETIDLINRYAEALDQVNHEVGFLQLWSILEKMTGTVGGGYDETIRRASWLFEDRKLAKDILECIRLRRNQYVHAAKSSDEPDQISYMLKNLVDAHLVHLIRNVYGALDLEDYSRHFALSTDLKTLKREIKWRETTIKLLRKRGTPKQ